MHGTLHLPRSFPPTRKRVPISKRHQLLGDLLFVEAALPGTQGLFSTLQDGFRRGDRYRLGLSCHVFDSLLADFCAIANSSLGAPIAWGACNACRRGMGGIWFLSGTAPTVWRAALIPPTIQHTLVTSNNCHCNLSSSDLELAGTLAHKQVLTQVASDAADCPIWLVGDNCASLSWATKGSSTLIWLEPISCASLLCTN